MDLNFLNDYWTQETLFSDKHFDSFSNFLKINVCSSGIPCDNLKTAYKGFKNWDMHFPRKKIAIEYKSSAITPNDIGKNNKSGVRGSFTSNVNSRTEEAIGCAVDLKHYDPEYKTGYFVVYSLRREKNIQLPLKIIKKVIARFDRMIENKIYDMYCPIVTFGINDHFELSKKYTFERFINELKEAPEQKTNSLEKFFV
jgi:hypothetical protein